MFPSSLSVFGSQDGSFTNLDVVDDAKIGGDLDVGGDVDVQGTVTASAFSGGTWTPTLTRLPDGSASSPPLSFTSGTNSGYYWDTTGTPGQAWTAGGTKRMKLDTTQLTLSTNLVSSEDIECNQLEAGAFVAAPLMIPTTAVRASVGSESNPSYTFGGQTTSGMYFSTSSGVSVTRSGSLKLSVDTNTVTVGPPLLIDEGTSLNPGLAFTTAPGLGFRMSDSDEISMCFGNNDTFQFSDSKGFDTNGRQISCEDLFCADIGCNDIDSGPITAEGDIDCGTHAMSCGSLACGSLTSSGDVTASGRVKAALGTVDFPGIAFTDAPSVGLQSGGPLAKTLNVCTDTNIVAQFSPLVTNFTVPIDCGTNSMTCGSLSCSSVTSTGSVTQPRYYARLYVNAAQSIPNSTNTAVSYDTIETSGGRYKQSEYQCPSNDIYNSCNWNVSDSCKFRLRDQQYRSTRSLD